MLDTPDFTWLSCDDAAADILLRQRDLERPRERIAQPVVAFAVTDLAKEYARAWPQRTHPSPGSCGETRRVSG
ncbi:hypothetical protein ACFXJ8_28015 [Nonomuraea sp. NPDC059194]|uniref:hypothetical protein n=1 Tax=Nonomuraea sp. NPDC059194 TaxID=3346764 RepID=UPI00369DC8BB